jgi:hypothetical protein
MTKIILIVFSAAKAYSWIKIKWHKQDVSIATPPRCTIVFCFIRRFMQVLRNELQLVDSRRVDKR